MHTHRSQSNRRLPARQALLIAFCVVLLAAFGPAAPSTAQAPPEFALVTDFGHTLYPGSSTALGGALSFTGAVVAGRYTFFQAFTPDAGAEIWRTDSTEAGTFMLKDICPGTGDQFPVPTLTAIGPTIYFPADDCVSGRELWKSDGTPAGTQRVKDINPGPDHSNPNNFFVAARQLFFTAEQATSTIWKSDGTDAGTSSTGVDGTPIFVLGSGLFFTSFVGGACSIKRLDATNGSVSDLVPFCPRSIYPSGFGGISIAAGQTLAYFTAGETRTGVEVWRTDGTPQGTFLLADISIGTTSSQPNNFVLTADDRLYFTASDGINGEELWLSAPAPVGTRMVKDINPGASSSGPSSLKLWNGLLYFSAFDGTSSELWRSDGSAVGTALVTDLTPSAGVSSFPKYLTPASNALFFVADDATHKAALFKTDGSAAGTLLVKDVQDSPFSGDEVAVPSAFGSGIFFSGNDGVHGSEPWVSDGTDAGTRMIKDITATETAGSRPFFATTLNDQLLYLGLNVDRGAGTDSYALYRSDGSARGTLALKTFGVVPRDESQLNQAPAVFNGALYFAAGDGDTALWRSDGTSTGTTLFIDVDPGVGAGEPIWLTPSGSTLFFSANDGSHGHELWKTDGTPETTRLIKDINAGGNGSQPEYLTPDGAGGVYFSAVEAGTGTELWHSDGTAEGTRIVLDIKPGASGSIPQNLTMAGTNLFFTAGDVSSGREIWVTNGTAEGTRRVRDINPGIDGTFFEPFRQPFAVLGTRVFFGAATDLFGIELWSSDGSEQGTAIVKDIYQGSISSRLDQLTVLNGALFLAATSSDSTRTLWRSDGTTAGTRPVASGPSAPVNPEALSAMNGQLYFSAADSAATAGRELWVSDGTPAGTRMLQDLNPGPTNSNPSAMITSGKRMYLRAYKPGAGVELWSSALGQPSPTPSPDNQRVYLSLTRR